MKIYKEDLQPATKKESKTEVSDNTDWKKPLRERMENMLYRIVGRVGMLQKSINEYKEAGDFENAMKCDIKMRTFKLIEEDLRKELQS